MQIGRLKSEWMFSLVHKCICAIWEVAPDSHLCLVVYVFFHVWPFIEFIITSYSCPFNLFKAFWIFGITHLNCRAQHLCKIMFFVSKLTPVLSVSDKYQVLKSLHCDYVKLKVVKYQFKANCACSFRSELMS